MSTHLERLVTALSAEQGWNLDRRTICRYATALSAYVTDLTADAEVRTVCLNYYADYQTVEAMLQADHPNHEQAWGWCVLQVRLTFARHSLQRRQQMMEDDDLVQTAMVEIVRSLPRFRYRSRLATWIYEVALRTLRRVQRDALAQKRSHATCSLEALFGSGNEPLMDDAHVEALAYLQALRRQIAEVLIREKDKRLSRIFWLHAVEDRPTEEIARLVHLHPSRVRALLSQARITLRHHMPLRSWLSEDSLL